MMIMAIYLQKLRYKKIEAKIKINGTVAVHNLITDKKHVTFLFSCVFGLI